MQTFITRIHPVCPEPAIRHSLTGQPGEPISSSTAAVCRGGVETMEIVWRSSADPQDESGPARRRPAETRYVDPLRAICARGSSPPVQGVPSSGVHFLPRLLVGVSGTLLSVAFVWCLRRASGAAGLANQASQKNENAQLTRAWWRRIAVSELTWKSAQPSSSLTCLQLCSVQWRIEQICTISARPAAGCGLPSCPSRTVRSPRASRRDYPGRARPARRPHLPGCA
jgi:hypothetical protein